MTDRFHSLTVILEHDMREDDAQMIIMAIKAVRGVLDVKSNVTDINTVVAEVRYQHKVKLLQNSSTGRRSPKHR